MEAKIVKVKGKSHLQVTLPIVKKVSKSGKNTIIASTGGNKAAGVKVGGKEVTIGLNAYTPIDEEDEE
jgi:hypothetical protein